jgi:hypothetical protein
MHRFTCASHEDYKFSSLKLQKPSSTVYFFSYLLEASDKNVMLIKKKSSFFQFRALASPRSLQWVAWPLLVATIGGRIA